jgi:hypothetical protein
MQLHFLRAFSSAVGASEGFVWISRFLITTSKSESAVDLPFIGIPPVIEAFSALLLVVPGFLVSDINLPEADGGNLGAGDCDAGGGVTDGFSTNECESAEGFLECCDDEIFGSLLESRRVAR